MGTKDTRVPDVGALITNQDYENMADKGRTGTEGLTKPEALAVIKVRFEQAARAYVDHPNGAGNWTKLMEAVAALQLPKGLVE